jgi:GH25 family lysozyme M1 (1,4-beta-N-acetylmuramidase)
MACLDVIKGKQFEYPIYFDLEEQKQFAKGKDFCSQLVRTFCTVIEDAGYWAGLYTSKSYLTTHIDAATANKYALWVAQWAAKCTYAGSYGMWQKSETGKVSGINGNVDLDECYLDYPSFIKTRGLNGFSKIPTPVTLKTEYHVMLKFEDEEKARAAALLFGAEVQTIQT